MRAVRLHDDCFDQKTFNQHQKLCRLEAILACAIPLPLSRINEKSNWKENVRQRLTQQKIELPPDLQTLTDEDATENAMKRVETARSRFDVDSDLNDKMVTQHNQKHQLEFHQTLRTLIFTYQVLYFYLVVSKEQQPRATDGGALCARQHEQCWESNDHVVEYGGRQNCLVSY